MNDISKDSRKCLKCNKDILDDSTFTSFTEGWCYGCVYHYQFNTPQKQRIEDYERYKAL